MRKRGREQQRGFPQARERDCRLNLQRKFLVVDEEVVDEEVVDEEVVAKRPCIQQTGYYCISLNARAASELPPFSQM